MNHDLLKLEFDSKILELRKQFNDAVATLEKEFYAKINCTTECDTNITINKQQFNYILKDTIFIDGIRNEYKKSSKHVYYSLNVLIDKYLECQSVGKQNGSARWFKQMLVYYPTQVNNILTTISNNLIDNYEKILAELGFIKQEETVDVKFDELVAKIKLLKNKNRIGRYKVALNKAKRLYPDKITILGEI